MIRSLALAGALLLAGPAMAATPYWEAGSNDPVPRVHDDNADSYNGAVQLTVGGAVASRPYRGIAATCSGAADLSLLMRDGSTLVWSVVAGFQYQPFAAVQITSTTAAGNCTRYQGLR